MGLSRAHEELKEKCLQSAERCSEGLLESRGLAVLTAYKKTLDQGLLEP